MSLLKKARRTYKTHKVEPKLVPVTGVSGEIVQHDYAPKPKPTPVEPARVRRAQPPTEPVAIKPPDAREPFEVHAANDQGIERLNIGKASCKALMRAGFETIGDLREVADGHDWTQHAGIGKTGAEKIAPALALYADTPEVEVEDEPEVEGAPFPVFESLFFVEDGLEVEGLGAHKFIMSGRLFDGINEAAIRSGLRTLADHKRIVLEVHSTHLEAVAAFADTFGIPFVRRGDS